MISITVSLYFYLSVHVTTGIANGNPGLNEPVSKIAEKIVPSWLFCSEACLQIDKGLFS
jgi:hypothetical protein